ncbi:hypothetical protein LTR09_004433 [Extremus antarcticus]|uniref:F-box domain-containing protein n=1 Tax=Extremus antarcticus TaxID=702011 RepID=A0AAJ0G9S3_9PEZI|nr:hypothetical protein LTR09_004433 [Extremus antarcticus]
MEDDDRPPPPTACARTINTVELLEQIILQLPCRSALGARQVSKVWRDTFDGCYIFREALCMAAIPRPTPHLLDFKESKGLQVTDFINNEMDELFPRSTWNISRPPPQDSCADATHV